MLCLKVIILAWAEWKASPTELPSAAGKWDLPSLPVLETVQEEMNNHNSFIT